MGFILYSLMFLAIFLIVFKTKQKIIKFYLKSKEIILEFNNNLNKEISKVYHSDSKTLFKQVHLEQGYDKEDVLNEDSTIDQFQMALANENVHQYAKDAQVVHSNSAFSINNIALHNNNKELQNLKSYVLGQEIVTNDKIASEKQQIIDLNTVKNTYKMKI